MIGGEYGARTIKTVSDPAAGYRPATDKVREALFSILESREIEWSETNIVDVFAGSGSLGLEGLSRGARSAWFIERDQKAVRVIRENLYNLGISRDRYRVIPKNAFSVLKRPPEKSFQLFFIDPPYGKGMLRPALEIIVQKWNLDNKTLIVAEVEKGLNLQNLLGLQVVEDRVYGQTRVYLCMLKE